MTVQQDAPVESALQLLRHHRVGCLLVLGETGKVSGILSERDIICRALGENHQVQQLTVAEIMTRQVISCSLNTPIMEAEALMAGHDIRHLPVIEDGKPVAMMSSRDVVAHQLSANMAMQAAAEQVAMLSKNFKSLDFDEVLHLVTREVPRIFGADSGVLCFPSRQGEQDVRVVSRNRCSCAETVLRREFQTDPGLPITFHDLPCECRDSGGASPRAVFRLPVYDGEDLQPNQCAHCAYLCMCHLSPAAAGSKELMSYKATLLQEILGVNLMNARLYERARRESQIDGLTKVNSRRVFEERLERESERSGRYGSSFCVSLIDVDNFKQVNDVCGHAVGDKVLSDLASVLRQGIRTTDVLARYGGDEFALLMSETDLERARMVLERLRSFAYSVVTDTGMPVTISCGVAEWSGEASDSGTEVLRRADEALYSAKRAGRNCVRTPEKRLAEPEIPTV